MDCKSLVRTEISQRPVIAQWCTGFAQILNLDTHTFTIGQIVDCLLLLLCTKYASESVEHLTL